MSPAPSFPSRHYLGPSHLPAPKEGRRSKRDHRRSSTDLLPGLSSPADAVRPVPGPTESSDPPLPGPRRPYPLPPRLPGAGRDPEPPSSPAAPAATRRAPAGWLGPGQGPGNARCCLPAYRGGGGAPLPPPRQPRQPRDGGAAAPARTAPPSDASPSPPAACKPGDPRTVRWPRGRARPSPVPSPPRRR